jgi:cation:H+ antiporter
MIWLQFAVAAALVVVAAVKLAEYGDVISLRTGLGGMLVGTLLMSAATSLPELLTTVNSLDQGAPNLAAGSVFGSNMFNMLLLAVLDLSHQQARVLRLVAARHALSGSLAALLATMALFFILADLDVHIAWVGIGSLALMVAYLVAVWLLRSSGAALVSSAVELVGPGPSLAHGLFGFGVASAVLVVVAPWLVRISIELAEISGLGTGFIGMSLLGTITSLPELVTVVAAARLKAYDLAVGNLFGSNLFNMFALGLTDVFYTGGNFLAEIDHGFAVAGLIGLGLTNLGLIGNLARLERRLLFVEADALLILLGYGGGMFLLYARGLIG